MELGTPFAVLLLALLVMGGLFLRRQDVRFAWAAGLAGLFLALVAWLGLGRRLPQTLVVTTWRLQMLPSPTIALRLDGWAWPVGIALTTLALAAWLQTALTRPGTAAWNWLLWLGLLMSAWAATLAADPLALLLAWTLFDGLDLTLTLLGHTATQPPTTVWRALVARMLSLYLLLWGALQVGGPGNVMAFTAPPAMLTHLIWLIVGLRWLLGSMSAKHGLRGGYALQGGSLLLTGAAILARVGAPQRLPGMVWVGIGGATLTAIALWLRSSDAPWVSGWLLAGGGVLWALAPDLTAGQMIAGAVTLTATGAVLHWLDVHHRLLQSWAATLLIINTLTLPVPWGWWGRWRLLALGALLALALLAGVGWHRWRQPRAPLAEVRIERLLWGGTLTLLTLPTVAFSAWRTMGAALPVAAGATLVALGMEHRHGQALRKRLQRGQELLRLLQVEERLWLALWHLGQNALRQFNELFESTGGLLWGMALVLILLLMLRGVL